MILGSLRLRIAYNGACRKDRLTWLDCFNQSYSALKADALRSLMQHEMVAIRVRELEEITELDIRLRS